MEREEQRRSMVELVHGMVSALVDNPDGVKVIGHFSDECVVVDVNVSSRGDLGKVIGKQGRTASSMRTIVGAASSKLKLRSVLNINSLPNEGGA